MNNLEKAWNDLLSTFDEQEDDEGMTAKQIDQAEMCFYCGALFIMSEFDQNTHSKKFKKFEDEIAQKLAMHNIEHKYEN